MAIHWQYCECAGNAGHVYWGEGLGLLADEAEAKEKAANPESQMKRLYLRAYSMSLAGPRNHFIELE